MLRLSRTEAEAGLSVAARRAVFAVTALFLAAQISPLYYLQGDTPGYLSIARSIAHGHGLLNRGSPVLWYPPGYSLLISPLFCFGDMPLLAISIFHFLLALALMYGIYLWAKRIAPDAALWAAVITVGTAAFGIHYRRVVSELSFMTAMTWAIVCMERALESSRRPLSDTLGWHVPEPPAKGVVEQFPRPSPEAQGRATPIGLPRAEILYALAAILLFGLSALIRSLGVALAGGVAVRIGLAAMKGRISWPRAFALAVPTALLPVAIVAAVTLRDRAYGHALQQDTYLTAIAEQTNPALKGSLVPYFAVVVNEIGRISIPGMWRSYADVGVWWDVNTLIYLPVALLLFAGWLRLLRRTDDILAWTLPFYFAILAYTRFESGARYWIPLTPLLVTSAWLILERLGTRRQRIFAFVWALHLLATGIFWIGRDRLGAVALTAQVPEARALAAQIDHDRDRVCVPEEQADFGYVLSLELDRRVGEQPKGGGPVPPGTRWLVGPAGGASPAEFTARLESASDRLRR